MNQIYKTMFPLLLSQLVACQAPSDPASNDGGAGVVRPNDEAINRLVASAGKISLTAQADAEPKLVENLSIKDYLGTPDGDFECSRTRYSFTTTPDQFAALSPNEDVLWPGSLVQGKSLNDGVLAPIPVRRAPGRVTLTLVNGNTGLGSKLLDQPSLSAAVQAQNELVANHAGPTPAKVYYSVEQVYSMEQLALTLNTKVNWLFGGVQGKLAFNQDDHKNRMLIQLTQSYFTMAFDPPQGAAGVFAPEVTVADLAPYVGAGNPPAYVSSVTYGRAFYLLAESTASKKDLEASLKAALGLIVSVDVNTTALYKRVLNESNLRFAALGGNAESALAAVATSADKLESINRFVREQAQFRKDNPGAPISFAVRHLGDSSTVRLALTTEYVAKDCRKKTVTPSDTLLQGTVCGLGHTTRRPNPTCQGQVIDQNAPNGNCPAGWRFIEACDLGAPAGVHFFACALDSNRVVNSVPDGLVCGYGHTLNFPDALCNGRRPQDGCPRGFEYREFGDLGAPSGQGFFACVANGETPLSTDLPIVPRGSLCGLSHTCNNWARSCGGMVIQRSPAICPAGYSHAIYGDRGGGSGEGQYACTKA